VAFLGSCERLDNEGRRMGSLPLEFVNEGLLVVMIVLDRDTRLGGARGPPGTDGLLGIFTGRGVEPGLAGVFLLGLVLEEEEDDGGLVTAALSPFFPEILALRPREAKKPPVLDVGVEDAKDRIEEVGVGALAPRLDVRGGQRWSWARDGYGRVGGTAETRSCVLSDRSVAVDASGRRGKVASEIIDDREVCLGWGMRVLSTGISADRLVFARNLVSITQSPRPQSYIYNSLILCAYTIHRSNAVFREYTSEQDMAEGFWDLIFRRGSGGTGNETCTTIDDGDGVRDGYCVLPDKRCWDFDDADFDEREEIRRRPVVKLFLKLFGGGLGVPRG
jgi:hypothetical protein